MPGSVIVFTDGGDDGKGVSAAELTATLRKEFTPAQPVTVTFIGYGEDVPSEELRRVARPTNGTAMVARTFEQARQIFLQVLANQVCVDHERCATRQG
jgi:hypothetical protein